MLGNVIANYVAIKLATLFIGDAMRAGPPSLVHAPVSRGLGGCRLGRRRRRLRGAPAALLAPLQVGALAVAVALVAVGRLLPGRVEAGLEEGLGAAGQGVSGCGRGVARCEQSAGWSGRVEAGLEEGLGAAERDVGGVRAGCEQGASGV
jgi:hypothetical protein